MQIGTFDSQTALKRFGFILLATMAWTLLFPSYAAYRNGSFYAETMRSKLPQAAQNKLAEFEAKQQELRQQVKAVNQRITELLGKPEGVPQVPELLKFRQALETELKSMTPPVVLKPFFLGTSMQFWPTGHLFLAAIIGVFAPIRAPCR